MIRGPVIATGLVFALACNAASAQTFIILTPDGARLTSSAAVSQVRFDNDAPDVAAVQTTGATRATAPHNLPVGNQPTPIGAPMPGAVQDGVSWPRAGSLNLSLDVQRFLPASQPPAPRSDETQAVVDATAARAGAGAPIDALAGAPLVTAAAAGQAPRSRVTRDGDDTDDLSLKFNVRGFSLLRMDGDADTHLQFRRVREREWRRPILSLTLQKRF